MNKNGFWTPWIGQNNSYNQITFVCRKNVLFTFPVSLLWFYLYFSRFEFIQEKTFLQNKSKFITEDYFVQHMNITINKSLIKWSYMQKIIKGPT